MDAPEASCSSRNLVPDGPMLPPGGESVHESHASASGGSNAPLATMLNSHVISPGNVTAAIKLNPTLPRNVSTSVIQSSWIQRLRPFSQSNTSKEEPTNFSNPVCTHFTKDFSSSSRRLNKSFHHTRSSSWPPHALCLQGVEDSPMELGEPADITERYGKAVVNSLDITHQSIRVPSNNITHSSDASSRTGNLFAQQQISCKQVSAVEGFVPRALNRENPTLKKLYDLQESESGRDSKPKECLAQKIQNSIEDVKKVNSVGECNVALQMKALVQTEEAVKNWDYSNGSRGASKGDIRAPVLSVSAYRAAHSSGASADADANIFFAESLNCCMENKTLPLQTSFVKPDCEIAFSTAVVSENRVNVDKAGEDWRFGRDATQTGLIIGSKDAGNLGFTRTVRNFKQFKESVEKPYLVNNFSNVRASSKFHLSPRNSHLSEAFNNANERDVMTTCAVGSRTNAASASLKKDVVSKRLDTLCPRENNLADLQNPHYSEGGRTSRSTLPVGSLHEDAARSRIREISLGEYWNSWVRLLEEPDNVKPAQAGSPTASSQQDYVVGEYHKNLFQPPLSKSRLDARQKFEDYWSCSPHKHVNDDAENFGSCDLPKRMLASSSKKNYKFLDNRISSSQTKTGRGQDCYALADQSSHFSLKGLQESQKHDVCFYGGATGRVDSQLHNEDSGLHTRFLDSTHPSQEVCNNERTGEGSSMHQVWIRRWHSSAKFSAVAGKATSHVPYFSRSLSSDQLVKSCSASAQCPLISSHRATGSFDHNLTDSGRGSNRYTEASGTRLDSGSASTTPGSLLAGRNFAAFRSGYMGSCVETMAVVGKSASKLPPTSLQNRGFCGLPCISPKFVKCKVLPEDEKMLSLDSDDLKALERHVDDS